MAFFGLAMVCLFLLVLLLARGSAPQTRYPDVESWEWINDGHPPGLTRWLDHNVRVSGISQPEYLDAVAGFMAAESSKQALSLERDPGNEFDRKAVKVMGIWRDAAGVQRTGQLGFVPHDVAVEVAREAPTEPLGASLQGIFRPTPNLNPGIRMDIWTIPRKPLTRRPHPTK